MFQLYSYAVDQEELQRVTSVILIGEFPKLRNWERVEIEKEINFWFEEKLFFFFHLFQKYNSYNFSIMKKKMTN